MKKTIFMLPALALMLFAACSSEDAVTKDNTAQLNETPENAIGFNAYLNRTVTRAGAPGFLVTSGATDGEVNLQVLGFGVFGYYADGDLYSENATPNFMYNQQVKFDGDWKYEPIKYWPNEFGSSAISTGVDRVTFFAYAPYVGVDPATGQLTTTYYDDTAPEKSTTSGITSLTRNGKSGDPYVRYVGAFDPANCVDLCYGVAAEEFTSAVGSGDGANNIKVGEPYLNVAKPGIGSKIYFKFKHALAKLKVQVDADVDVVGHNGSDVLDGNTRIWVRSITFDGIAQRGYLNLNSGMWYDVMDNTKISHASVTVHDGRRDGSEALADDDYESPIGFNSALVQSVEYTKSETTTENGVPKYTGLTTTGATGVTASYQNLFANSGSLLVIPANEQLKVTIVYDVETADATLPTYLSDGVTKGSTVENKITKNITLGGGSALKLESGNAYTLNLHLGMTSVKFDATVKDWESDPDADADLPINSDGTFAAALTHTVTWGADATGPQTLTISGLTNGNTLALNSTASTIDGPVTGTPSAETISDNKSEVSYTLAAANTTVLNQSDKLVFEEKDGGDNLVTTTTINIVRKAHALGLSVNGNPSASTISLNSTATGMTDWTANLKNISITKNNGSAMERVVDGDPTGNQFKLDAGSSGSTTITLGTAVAAGDKYVITIQEGDAPAEAVTVVVGDVAASAGPTDLGNIEYDTNVIKYIYGLTPGSTLVVTKTGDGKDVITATLSAAIVPATGVVQLTITNNNSGSTDSSATVYVTESGAGSTVTAFTLNAKKQP